MMWLPPALCWVFMLFWEPLSSAWGALNPCPRSKTVSTRLWQDSLSQACSIGTVRFSPSIQTQCYGIPERNPSYMYTGSEDDSVRDLRKSLISAEIRIGWPWSCPFWFWDPPNMEITASEWPPLDSHKRGKCFSYTHLTLLYVTSWPPDIYLWRTWNFLLNNILTVTGRLLGETEFCSLCPDSVHSSEGPLK